MKRKACKRVVFLQEVGGINPSDREQIGNNLFPKRSEATLPPVARSVSQPCRDQPDASEPSAGEEQPVRS